MGALLAAVADTWRTVTRPGLPPFLIGPGSEWREAYGLRNDAEAVGIVAIMVDHGADDMKPVSTEVR